MINVSIGIPVMPNREKYIDKCIKSVVEQTYLEPYEIIIAQHPGYSYRIKIENKPEHITIKYIDSDKSLSSKRNDFIKHSSGKYIINIDDDVIAEHDWLENMINSVIKNGYDVFWGSARPIYEKEFPEKLDVFEMLIGGFHYDRKGELRRRGLIGCNFGFRNGLRHKTGKFFEQIGRGGSLVSGGEEVLFLEQCIDPKIGFIERSIVNHYIQANRINLRYVIKNRCSNIKARIFINHILNINSYNILIMNIKNLIKAFYPQKGYLKNIMLQIILFYATIYNMIKIKISKTHFNVT